MKLTELIRPGALREPGESATATPATPATLQREQRPAVAAVAAVAVADPRDAKTDPPPLTAEDAADIAEVISERAGIMEFDGKLPRSEAEHAAAAIMRVYRLLIGMEDGPPRWVTMLAPGCTLAEAERDARLRFGEQRVIEVREQR
jgi:hypothetical protein